MKIQTLIGFGKEIHKVINLKNKFAIGCLVQWYEIELVEEYLQSIKNTLDTIANIPSIINVLGCMFAPNNPACQKDMQDKPVSALTDAELN